MFDGHAEEAMNFYVSLFDNAEIKTISLYTKHAPGKEGSVKYGVSWQVNLKN
jgi:predicted 3-demethylubiquinone-9 3-methyltransferase (glyoxalase superfamily)